MTTDKRWRQVLRMVNEVFGDYETGLVALRKRVVVDLKRKLSDSGVLDRPDLEQPLPGERPASAAGHPARGARPGGRMARVLLG